MRKQALTLQEERPIGDVHALEQAAPHQFPRFGARKRARRRIGEDDRAIAVVPGHQITDVVEQRPGPLVRCAIFAEFRIAPAQHQCRDHQCLYQRSDDEKRHRLPRPLGGRGESTDLAADDNGQERRDRDHTRPEHEFPAAEAGGLDRHDDQPGQQRRIRAARRPRQGHDEERERSSRDRVRDVEPAGARQDEDRQQGQGRRNDQSSLEGAECATPGEVGRGEPQRYGTDEQARQDEALVAHPFAAVGAHRCMHQRRRLYPQCCHHQQRNA